MKRISFVLLGLIFMTSCIMIDEDTTELDFEAPVISIISPTTNFSYLSSADRITISGIASDNIGVTRIEWQHNNGLTKTASGKSAWKIENIQINTGDNIFLIIAYDEANNKDSVEFVVSYNEFISFLSAPTINPNGFFINATTDVKIKISILKNTAVIENSIKLIRVDKKGNEMQEIGQLFDDGDLSHFDDIKGDGVYCGIHSFSEATSTDIYLRVKATSQETGGNVDAYSEIRTISIVDKVPETLARDIIAIQEEADSEFQMHSSNLTRTDAINQTIEYLLKEDYVQNASMTESGDIWIVYEYNLEGNIITSEEG